MANKKVTKRERRDEAKRRRLEELRRRQRKARMRKITYAAVAALVVAGIAGGIVLARSASNKKNVELSKLATAAGCEALQTFSSEGQQHIQPPRTVNYKTNPPTSGNHYGTTANTGIHATPVQNELQVHNLEHGHVVIQYKPTVAGTVVDALKEVTQGRPTYVLLAPNPNIPDPLAFSAWSNLITCKTPTDPAAVKSLGEAFVGRFADKGPESNRPGQPTGV